MTSIGASAPWMIGGLILGIIAGYLIRRWVVLRHKNSLEKKAQEILETAKTEAKELIVEAKDKAASQIEEAQKEIRGSKEELKRLEERIRGKEDAVDAQKARLEAEETEYKAKRVELKKKEEELEGERSKIEGALEKVAGLSADEALRKLKEEVEKTHREELGTLLARLEKEKRNEIEKKSTEIITTALQRYSRSNVADLTTSVVHLEDEEIKGKIIGKEGRNIKAFERLTGVEVVVDESPDNIVISSFDPLRREVARVALEKLIRDGRIQPAKIEEKIEEARQELDTRIREAGEEAAYEVGILDLPKEILYLLGRLKFRTSYGQNVLLHSVEMAHLSGMIASELGLNVEVAKKGALLHDIGKVIDQETEGTHVEIGRKLLKKYSIDERVIQAMEAHHEEYPHAIPEAYVVSAADAISGARPGARRETVEKYLKRLEDIERTVKSFPGIAQVYAVSGGREVRVFVVPEKIDDFGALELARNAALKIKSDVQYPGEIKVVVIREVKAVEYAR